MAFKCKELKPSFINLPPLVVPCFGLEREESTVAQQLLYSVMFMQKVLINFIIFIFLCCETSCKVFLQRHEQFGVDFGTPTSSSTFRYSPTRTSIKHIRRVGRLRSVQAAARRFIYSTSFVIRRADLTSVDSK